MESTVNEEWRDIEGYEGLYQVSNLGRVKKLYKSKEIIRKPFKNRDGYLTLGLSKDNKERKYFIHRLVAGAFIGYPENYTSLEVNHKDENKENNCVDNLEWCTHKENVNWGTHYQRMVKTQSIPVLQFDLEGNFIKRWDSIAQASRELTINPGSISNCCRGITKTAYKFIWRYELKDY